MSIAPIAKMPWLLLDVKESDTSCETVAKIKEVALAWYMQSSLQEDLPENLPAKKILYSLSSVSLKLCLQLPYVEKSGGKVYVCTHKESIEAIAVTKENSFELTLCYLVTNPHNVRCSSNEKIPERVAGAATAIIHHLFSNLSSGINSIALESTHSALPFYEKLGFEQYKKVGRRGLFLRQTARAFFEKKAA